MIFLNHWVNTLPPSDHWIIESGAVIIPTEIFPIDHVVLELYVVVSVFVIESAIVGRNVHPKRVIVSMLNNRSATPEVLTTNQVCLDNL